MKNLLIAFALLLCLTSSCKKTTSKSLIPNGNYSGVLEVSSDVYKMPSIYPITITFENEKYKVSSDPASKEVGGSGTYSSNGSIGNFNDENIWQANFDWNMILKGEYEIRSNGNDLILIKRFKASTQTPPPAVTIVQTYYKYILKKVK
ncbi:hypothetical protein EV200_101442 [Pedobacter psychrotolerans]|uniref:Lipocalin-like protein n=2 Tax=Pedobacter psychrotolerans TaxID=1843235 RepID=A0A4V2S0B5_9SPHI|nr:hypothetical protein [Pedobacter psychrotolerans]TCO30996.1 hypothetical protein EV200_101442 [Pedobacter psychrotolerans]